MGCLAPGIGLGVADMVELATLAPRLQHVKKLNLAGLSAVASACMCTVADSECCVLAAGAAATACNQRRGTRYGCESNQEKTPFQACLQGALVD